MSSAAVGSSAAAVQGAPGLPVSVTVDVGSGCQPTGWTPATRLPAVVASEAPDVSHGTDPRRRVSGPQCGR